MLTDSVKSHLLFLIAVAVGSIGAFGQAYLLYHELVECYPYKMMNFPLADYYVDIADIGIYFAPLIAVAVSLFFRSKIWSVPIVSVILCPLLFVCVYRLTFIAHQWNGFVDTGHNFGGTTAASVAQGFFVYAIGLSITGLIVGSICGFILSRFSTVKKLA